MGEHPKGTTILILGILSIVCCGVFTGIPALIMGNKAQAEIAAGQYAPTTTVKIGRILGMISIAWTVIVLVLWIVLFAAS